MNEASNETSLFNLLEWKPYRDKNSEDCIIDQVSIDSRRIHSKHSVFIALNGTRTNGHLFVRHALDNGAHAAIVQKGFTCEGYDSKLIHVESPLLALQQLAGIYRTKLDTQFIAITGICGKTMLKDLLSHMFSSPEVFASPESFNSQIGVALSVLSVRRHHKIAFIEAAATKIGEMNTLCSFLKPDCLIVTNVSQSRLSHEDPHVSALEALTPAYSTPSHGWVLAPKTSYLNSSSVKSSCHFWNQHSSILPTVTRDESSGLWRVRTHDGSESSFSLFHNEHYFHDLLNISVKGGHLLGKHVDEMIHSLSTWLPEPMRTEVWRNQKGIIFINDTYSKDIMSFDIALRQIGVFEGRLGQRKGIRSMIFGGLRDHPILTKQQAEQITRSCSASLLEKICIWPKALASQLKPYFTQMGSKIEIFDCSSLEDAIQKAKAEIRPDDLIVIKGPNKINPLKIIAEFEGSTPHNLIIINLASIQSNIQTLRKLVGPKTRIMVMVKALAYGTDDVRIAKFLNASCEIDILGVSYVDEGVSMRLHGVTCNLFTLHASSQEMVKALENNLEVGVSSSEQIHAAQKAAEKLNKRFKLHLHVDTGMKRMGCTPEEALSLAELINNDPRLILEGIFSHLAASDNPNEDDFTKRQTSTLLNVYKQLQQNGIHVNYCHASNSSATMRFPNPEFNMVRVGLAAYGLHTSHATQDIPLRPAISLLSKIVAFNTAYENDTVSYGRTHTIQKTTRIAVLPIGYFDGLHRNYSGKGHVLIRGKKAPMIGRICMDYMMVDVGHIPDAALEDQALIFGEDEKGLYISPEELAHAGGSIVHELMTCLGPRIQRLFIYDESLRAR